MYGLMEMALAVLAGAGALTLVSYVFADGVSRAVEAAFDAVEYRLALRAQRAREFRPAGGVFVPARASRYGSSPAASGVASVVSEG